MLLAIDQGTTGTTCLVVDEELQPRGRGYREVPQHFPRPGWVEHDPEELWDSVVGAAEQALAAAGIVAGDLSALGVTNQRETTVVWDRLTGKPVRSSIAGYRSVTAMGLADPGQGPLLWSRVWRVAGPAVGNRRGLALRFH